MACNGTMADTRKPLLHASVVLLAVHLDGPTGLRSVPLSKRGTLPDKEDALLLDRDAVHLGKWVAALLSMGDDVLHHMEAAALLSTRDELHHI